MDLVVHGSFGEAFLRGCCGKGCVSEDGEKREGVLLFMGPVARGEREGRNRGRQGQRAPQIISLGQGTHNLAAFSPDLRCKGIQGRRGGLPLCHEAPICVLRGDEGRRAA